MSSLQLNRREILRYLGCTAPSPPASMTQAVERGCAHVLDTIRPKSVWRCFPLQGSRVGETALELQGEDIRRHLAGCSQAVLMAVTLGSDIERLLMRWEVRDLAFATVLDACASEAVEAVCNDLEAALRTRFASDGLHLTGRFSPGYGDLPLSHQRELCELLDAQRRIGLTLSPTGLMIPRKSVTAVLGLSRRAVSRREDGCRGCSMFQSCPFRKGGNSCV